MGFMRGARLSVRYSIALLGLAMTAELRAQDSPAQALHALFEREWQWTLRESPEFASSLGDLRYNERWEDVSLDAIERRQEHRKQVLAELARIDPAGLSPADRLNYRLFERQYRTDIEAHQYRYFLVPIDIRSGIQIAHLLSDSLPFRTSKDYEDWLARLRNLPEYVDQTIALLREGIRAGMVQPEVIMKRLPAQIDYQIVSDPAESPFYKPFRRFPEAVPPAQRERLGEEARRLAAERVVPAYRKFKQFFVEEYLPAAPKQAGVSHWPDGENLYAFRTRYFTTTALTPRQIHETGLAEVRRIRGEMEAIIRETGFEGSFARFLEHLRSDPKFYIQDPQALLKEYRALAKRIDPGLGRLFGRLPRTPYGVEPIPASIAPDTTTAYYEPPSADGLRAGTYFVNLYKPETRPIYEMEALSLHEAVPGHHLQIALAMEQTGLPEFRRFGHYTAFVEGWALYAENLGADLGLYQDPYAKFGQLTYEMWRAVRLVVDTGMHAFGWSRERAIRFFLDNAAKTEQDVVNEIDRYIGWSGQALAYKIGELKIKELRARAERELGDRFDVRAFHDALLENGALPLDVLEESMAEWIASRTATQSSPR
jgi:uncharacterized protein (DUF885 family)